MKTEILKYLMEHYGISENRGIELIAKHHKEVASAERWASAPYFPANQIANAENIPHREPCLACEIEEKEGYENE